MKLPKLKDIQDYNHKRLEDYKVSLFTGLQIKRLFDRESNHITLVGFTKEDIDLGTYYKCWYSEDDAHDWYSNDTYYKFVYIEQVPDDILWILRQYEKVYTPYIKDKSPLKTYE